MRRPARIADTDSGVNMQLKLVHYYREPAYTEAGTDAFNAALDAVRGTDDGAMDDVHALRMTYAADLVAMIINDTGGVAGLASLGPSSARMFSVVHHAYALGSYSFGHEIAHNLGCKHDRGTKDQCEVWNGTTLPVSHLGSGPHTDLLQV